MGAKKKNAEERFFDNLIGYDEVAQWLGVPKSRLYQWVFRNQIPHIRITGKMVRFNKQQILKWLERSQRGA